MMIIRTFAFSIMTEFIGGVYRKYGPSAQELILLFLEKQSKINENLTIMRANSM